MNPDQELDFKDYLKRKLKEDPSLRGQLDEAGKVLKAEQRIWDAARKGDLDFWEKALGDFEILAKASARRETLEGLMEDIDVSGEPISAKHLQGIIDQTLEEMERDES